MIARIEKVVIHLWSVKDALSSEDFSIVFIGLKFLDRVQVFISVCHFLLLDTTVVILGKRKTYIFLNGVLFVHRI